MLKAYTIYMMRLWQDRTISVVWSGRTIDGARRFVADIGASCGNPYDGRQWLAATPIVRPAPPEGA